MSTLSQYLKSTGQTQSAFAKRIGISQNYLSEISRGLRVPSLAVAYKIELDTGGVVPMRHWLAPENPGQAESHTAIPNASETKEA